MPGFPIYKSTIRTLGAMPVSMSLVESRGFSFDLNQLRDKFSTKNPTGGA